MIRSSVENNIGRPGELSLLEADLPIDGAACRAARALLDISQTRLCELLGFSRNVLNEFESGSHMPRPGNVARIREVLEASGVVFINMWDGSLGVGMIADRVDDQAA